VQKTECASEIEHIKFNAVDEGYCVGEVGTNCRALSSMVKHYGRIQIGLLP
jgi:hypothetical protein